MFTNQQDPESAQNQPPPPPPPRLSNLEAIQTLPIPSILPVPQLQPLHPTPGPIRRQASSVPPLPLPTSPRHHMPDPAVPSVRRSERIRSRKPYE